MDVDIYINIALTGLRQCSWTNFYDDKEDGKIKVGIFNGDASESGFQFHFKKENQFYSSSEIISLPNHSENHSCHH